MPGSPKQRWAGWVLCVLTAAVPLFLFIVTLSVFRVGDGEMRSLTTTPGFSPDILRPFAEARLAIVTLDYGWWVFAHILLCISVTAYFATLLAGHAKRSADDARFYIGSAAFFILAIAGVLAFFILAPNRSGQTVDAHFANLVITPLYYFLAGMGLSGQFNDFGGDPWLYLALAALGPTAFGILCVTIGSAVFHLGIQNRRPAGSPGWEKDFAANLRALKTYAAVLSLILVSSTLTARTYYHIVPSMLIPPSKDTVGAGPIYTIYNDFADTISTASGVLFTMTLIATFAPGLIILLRDISSAMEEKGDEGRQSLLETLGLTNLRTNLATLLKIGMTIASPALASPIAEVFQTL